MLGATVVGILVELMLSKNLAVPLLALVLLPVGTSVGVNRWVVVITLLAAASMWFIPSQTSIYLIAFSASKGRLYSHAQPRRTGFAYVVAFPALALTVPIWYLVGIL